MVEQKLAIFLASEKFTQGAEELSRQVHAQEALDSLRTIDSLERWMWSELDHEADKAWLCEIIAQVAFLAFDAGRRTQAAWGKDFERYAVAKLASQVAFGSSNEGRDLYNEDRKAYSIARKEHAKLVDAYEQDMAVWSAPEETSAILAGTFRSEYDVAITFALGVGSDRQSSNNFQGIRFGQQNLASSLLSGSDGAFTARTPSGGGFSGSSAPGVHASLLSASLPAPRAAYEAALASTGAVAVGFGYALLIGVAYVSRQIWVGPAGYIKDAVTGAFVAVANGQVINEASSDGVDENPELSASITYRAF